MFLSKRTTSCCDKVRRIHLQSFLQKTHYDSLGLTRRATQNDIKNAYYKLSMLYHPDKNSGSEIAAEKFRDINTAYEILGNLKLRKLYDKGMLRSDFQTANGHTKHEDVQTEFYKSHMNRSKPPPPDGRTPIYNFDEWAKSHYADTFLKKLRSKEKFDARERYHIVRGRAAKTESVIFMFTCFTLAIVLMSYSVSIKGFDEVALDLQTSEDPNDKD